MSYQQYYPPPGYGSTTTTHPLPAGYSTASQYMVPSPSPSPPPPPSEGYPYHYPPSQPPVYQGYLTQDYPPPPPPTQHPYYYHCEYEDDPDDCSSFLRGWLAALCFCCVLEECF